MFSISQQVQAEAEEEFISNTLLKKIHCLKKEKETLAMNYEQEEEFLTNDLSRKLAQVGGYMYGAGLYVMLLLKIISLNQEKSNISQIILL